jgi:hypothetical protein
VDRLHADRPPTVRVEIKPASNAASDLLDWAILCGGTCIRKDPEWKVRTRGSQVLGLGSWGLGGWGHPGMGAALSGLPNMMLRGKYARGDSRHKSTDDHPAHWRASMRRCES